MEKLTIMNPTGTKAPKIVEAINQAGQVEHFQTLPLDPPRG